MNGLDWNREINRDRDVLERILALLFLLAGLADRAACLPGHRRRQVLGILACGEVEARAFVIGLAGAPVTDDVEMQDPKAASDAERLAVSFRVLALVLGAMLAQSRRSAPAAGRHAVSPIVLRRPWAPALSRLPLRALPAPDTS